MPLPEEVRLYCSLEFHPVGLELSPQNGVVQIDYCEGGSSRDDGVTPNASARR